MVLETVCSHWASAFLGIGSSWRWCRGPIRFHRCRQVGHRAAHSLRGTFVFRSDLPGNLLCFLVVVGLNHIAHDRSGHFAPVTTPLYDDANGNFRIAARSVSYKPGVILKLQLLGFSESAAQIVINHLCRPRFATELDSREP